MATDKRFFAKNGLNNNNQTITKVANPINQDDAATKNYVDSITQGLGFYLDPARASTTINLDGIYDNSGKTLTNNGTRVAIIIDGITLSSGDRVLLKDQTAASQNGIYTVTVEGNESTNWVLTRAMDFDTTAEVVEGASVFVEEGVTNAGSSFVQTATSPILDIDDIIWMMVSRGDNIYAGTGLDRIENTIYLTDTTVNAGSYGSNIIVPTFIVDAQGRLTTANNVNIRPGTTSETGIVQLEDSVSSTSVTTAATPNSVKAVYDLANIKLNASAVSSFALTYLDDITATATLTTLGAAPIISPTFTGIPTAPTAVVNTDTAQLATTSFVQNQIDYRFVRNIIPVVNLDIDCSLGNYYTKTINADSTFTFSNAPAGVAYAFTLELTHNSGNVTWPTSVKWRKDTAPTLTTGKTHLFVFVTDDGGSRWRGSELVDYVN